MTMTDVPVDEINLADPQPFLEGRAHDIFTRLRRERPIHGNNGPEPFLCFWNITKFDDIIAISRQPNVFISGKGIVMGTDPDNPTEAAGLGKMMIVTDPPRHVRLRRLVNKGFTPRMISQLEPHIRQITTGLLDDIADKGECDFVTEVSAQLPLAVICEMMGVPRDDWQRMFELTNKVLGGADPEYQAEGEDDVAAVLEGHRQMFMYFGRMLMERRAQRREDLVSVLAEAEVDGEKLTDEEILYFCYLLILAGNETTRNAISGGLLALCEHPDQKQRLLDDPDLMTLATDEIIRWVSPVLHMMRYCVEDTEVGDQLIRKGQRVALWYPSANRDEDVFEDPFVFDIGRTPNDHLAFGLGEHFCLGAGLARLEIRVMFEELLRRFPSIELAGPPERLRSNFIGGIKHLPVRYIPA
jgi:cytochrome P450